MKEVARKAVESMKTRYLKLALAESCTGGLISSAITDVPGSSEVLLMGVVAYSNEAKTRVLGVPDPLLAMYGAVSEEAARAMAEGVRGLAGSDIALAVTGIAGPGGGSAEKPVGTVYISITVQGSCRVFKYLFSGDRTKVREQTVDAALDLLEQSAGSAKTG